MVYISKTLYTLYKVFGIYNQCKQLIMLITETHGKPEGLRALQESMYDEDGGLVGVEQRYGYGVW